MRIIRRVFNEKHNTIHAMGDFHIGAAACDKAYIAKAVKHIAETGGHVILMGDIMDMIRESDKRHNRECLDPDIRMCDDVVKWQIAKAAELLKPLKGKILAGLVGNHEATINKTYGIRPMDALADRLDFPCLGYSGFISIGLGRERQDRGPSCDGSVTIFAHHGYGGGRRRGGKVNKVEDFAKDFDADVFLMGHVHTCQAFIVERLGITTGGKPNLISKRQYFGLTGTALKTYQYAEGEEAPITYSEQFGYAPTPIGHLVIELERGAGARPIIDMRVAG